VKVLHVEAGRQLYGGALQVVFLINALRELTPADEHILVCARGSAVALAAAGVARIIELPMGGDADVGMVVRLRRVIRAERPDLVHLHSRRGADLWGGLAARLAGVPAVLSRRVDNPEPRWLVALKYRLYRHVVAISGEIHRVLLREGVAEPKVSCVHSAMDTERYCPDGDHAWLCSEFNLPAEARVIGMIAQFIPRKGHHVLLDAVPAVLARHPEARFLLFGHGPLQREIGARIRREGLEAAVRLPGFRVDLPRILPALDLVVHPAAREGLGVALLQAAACGVPIVAGAAGGIPEIVRHGVNGWLVAPADAAGFAERINALLDDPDQAAAFGRAGRRLVRREFTIAAMAAGNLDVYRRVLKAGG